MITQHWFRYWPGAFRQEFIIWANVDPDLCRHMASLSHNELMPSTCHPWKSAISMIRGQDSRGRNCIYAGPFLTHYIKFQWTLGIQCLHWRSHSDIGSKSKEATALNTESCYDANFVVTSGIWGRPFDNRQWRYWRQNWQHGVSLFSVGLCSTYTMKCLENISCCLCERLYICACVNHSGYEAGKFYGNLSIPWLLMEWILLSRTPGRARQAPGVWDRFIPA